MRNHIKRQHQCKQHSTYNNYTQRNSALAADPNDIAMGKAPSVVASVVIRMGLSLATETSMAAGIFLSPSSVSGSQIQQSISRSW
jgi:hypothetical protein